MKYLFLACFIFLAACSSTPPVKPAGENVEASRDPADKDCKEIGPVEGRTINASDDFDVALKNLKNDAAIKGANYVHIRQSGAMGTSVRGMAYLCL